MNDFLKHFSNRLYKMEDTGGSRSEVYLVLPRAKEENSLSLSDAVTNLTGHDGLLVFSGQAMGIKEQGQADQFADRILTFFQTKAKTDRAILWLCENDSSDLAHSFFMGINRDASRITSSLRVPLVTDLEFMVQNGGAMTFDGTAIQVTLSSGSCVSFAGARAPKGYSIPSASLSLNGDCPGTFSFPAFLYKNSFFSCLNPGFSMSCPASDEGIILETINFPLFSPDSSATDAINFQVSISPVRRYGRDTRFAFLPAGENDLKLPSFFTTIYGDPICLQPVTEKEQEDSSPACFVFCGSPQHALPLCPEGDFKLWNASGHENNLMCGINGMEYIRFSPGDILRFSWGNPGFIPVFPLPETSTVGEPVDLKKEPADCTYLTSWACLCRAKDPLYLTQPTGMCYYGSHGDKGASNELLFQTETFCCPDKNATFPMFPFGGAIANRQKAEAWERQILSPLRLKRLTASGFSTRLKGEYSFAHGVTKAATPNGFLVDIDDKGLFRAVYLANNDYKGLNLQMFFEEPCDSLVAAFQSNPLFLVVNHPGNIGIPAAGPQPQGSAAFHNTLNIGDWLFSFTPGEGNRYNDYKTIMIVKGCRGKLYDPGQGGLVSSPMSWTRWQDFASPLSDKGPDESQLANLSTWLMDYCRKAMEGESRYFGEFSRIITDENWQGILFLNVPLSWENFPEDLRGVLMGLPQGTSINAHHIGINMTALKHDSTGLHQDGCSSLFGLIYYEDAQFKETKKPVSPASGQYDFRLLSLKVLFKNSALKDFENYAQLTMGSWFGLTPDHLSGGDYNSMLLKGGYQLQNGNLCYTLRGVSDCLYYFENDYLNKIEVTQVKMEAPDSQNHSCLFRLGGFLDCKELSDYDLFSYGNKPGEDLTRQGLCFSNLVLSMAKETAEDSCPAVFTLLTDQISFDLNNSVCRPDSLAHSLALTPKGILQSKEGSSPGEAGFLPVHTEKNFAAPGDDWYGLTLDLPMGTLGELASQAGIAACLLLAFAPQPSGEKSKIALWMKLPGTGQKKGFLSLQNLMSLSIDQIWLKRESGRFRIDLTDISLKIFSLLTIPPEGSTDFTLFGSGQEGAEPGWFAKYQKQKEE